jgi:putative transposase
MSHEPLMPLLVYSTNNFNGSIICSPWSVTNYNQNIYRVKKDLLKYKRKSFMEIGEIFFWTATINNWQKLLLPDQYKDVIIDSLDYLNNIGKIDVFGFVLMPTHVHLIWRTKKLNGKETAQGSFLKYTAHEFRKMLYRENRRELLSYQVEAYNKKHEFWQRDSLAILLYNREVAFQKLDYIHYNPLAELGNWPKTRENINIHQRHIMK